LSLFFVYVSARAHTLHHATSGSARAASNMTTPPTHSRIARQFAHASTTRGPADARACENDCWGQVATMSCSRDSNFLCDATSATHTPRNPRMLICTRAGFSMVSVKGTGLGRGKANVSVFSFRVSASVFLCGFVFFGFGFGFGFIFFFLKFNFDNVCFTLANTVASTRPAF
jgi:hypothetical protein